MSISLVFYHGLGVGIEASDYVYALTGEDKDEPLTKPMFVITIACFKLFITW